MYQSHSTSAIYLHRNAPKIVDTIRINGKYFEVSKIKDRIWRVATFSAIASALMAIGAMILF